MTTALPEIRKPTDRKYLSILVYGETAAGKSWLAASAESSFGGRTLIAMAEDADVGLVGFDVDIVHVRNSATMWALLRALKAGQPPYDAYRDGVLVFDSLTQLQKFLHAEDSEELYKRERVSSPLFISRDTYRKVGEEIRRMLWFARTLPMHVVYICLSRPFADEDGVVKMQGPDLTPSLSADVRAYCDVVAYLVAEAAQVRSKDGTVREGVVRRLWLQPGKDFFARVRAGRDVSVPPYIVNPTLPKLLEVIRPAKPREGGE